MVQVVPYVIYAVVSVAVGYAMQALQKPVKSELKLGDIAKQTAKEGGARLIVWGIVRPIGGNIVACSDPNIVSTTTSSGGKGGGGGSEQTTENVYRTYAVGVCEGPITGYRRIWRNNKLVYDSRTDDAGVLNTWGATNNPVFLQKATFYLGDYAQLPDPSLEGIFGVGEVPAMRGTAYMVMNNENLTELGGAVPQYIFEVVRAEGVSLTSRPYPLESGEELKAVDFSLVSGEFRHIINRYDNGIDNLVNTDFSLVSGIFRDAIHDYSYQESIVSSDFSLISGVFKSVLHSYEYQESLESLDFELVSGVFRDALIHYEDGLPEELTTITFSIVEGSHGS